MSLTLSIEIEGPATIGESLEVVVVIESDAERRIDALDLELEGRRMLFTNQEREQTLPFFEQRVRLLGKTSIEKGTRRVPVSLALPSDLPPTCDAGDLWVAYTLRATADVPWWWDPVELRDVTLVLPRPDQRPPRDRWVTESKARGDALYVELALDDLAFAPGESITGAFSVGNVSGHRLDGAEVSLVPERGSIALGVPNASPVFKSLVGAAEGSVIHFAVPVPREAVPSHESRIGSVARALRVSIDGTGVSCEAPITIDAYPPRSGHAESQGELIGKSRWRSGWSEVGDRYGLVCDRDALRLSGALAGGAVEVSIEPRGNQLSAKLTWERFGIDLAVRGRGLIEVTDVELRLASPTFRKRFVARGREEAQVVAALGPELCEAIEAFGEIVLRDAGARVGMDAQARDAEALGVFVSHIDALASAVAATEAHIPPPACFDERAAAAWRAFAELTTGRLRQGSMSVLGAVVDGDHVDVETLFEAGSVSGTRVTLALDPEAPVPDPVIAPGPLVAAARAAAPGHNDAPGFELEASAMTVTLPTMIADPAALRPLLMEMQRHARALRGETTRGPYR